MHTRSPGSDDFVPGSSVWKDFIVVDEALNTGYRQ